MNIVQDKLDRLIALDREDPAPDPAMAELRAASAGVTIDGWHKDGCFFSSKVQTKEDAGRVYIDGELAQTGGAWQHVAIVIFKPASAEAQPAWRPLDIETTYGSEAAADAAQILHAPMVVEGTFEHSGETYRFKAKPEREAPMTELRAASAEARPAVGLVERVAEAMQPGTFDWSAYEDEARAAIREVATWLDRFALHGSGEYAQAAKVLRQEVGQ
jgi:hypothetical protein